MDSLVLGMHAVWREEEKIRIFEEAFGGKGGNELVRESVPVYELKEGRVNQVK